MFWQIVVPFLSAAVGMAIVGWLWTFGAQNYLGKYLAKKAENLATHQDIQKLVDQVRETERVKSEIADPHVGSPTSMGHKEGALR